MRGYFPVASGILEAASGEAGGAVDPAAFAESAKEGVSVLREQVGEGVCADNGGVQAGEELGDGLGGFCDLPGGEVPEDGVGGGCGFAASVQGCLDGCAVNGGRTIHGAVA